MKPIRFPALAREQRFELTGNIDDAKKKVDKDLYSNGEFVAEWKDDGLAVIEPVFAAIMNPVDPHEMIEEGRRVLTANLYVYGERFSDGIIGFLPEEVTQEEFETADETQHNLWGWKWFQRMGFYPVGNSEDHCVFALKKVPRSKPLG